MSKLNRIRQDAAPVGAVARRELLIGAAAAPCVPVPCHSGMNCAITQLRPGEFDVLAQLFLPLKKLKLQGITIVLVEQNIHLALGRLRLCSRGRQGAH